jgi:hypothetical protein
MILGYPWQDWILPVVVATTYVGWACVWLYRKLMERSVV